MNTPEAWDLLIFDWDGTAVPDRATPVPDLLRALESALQEARLICVVVTGTNVDNLLRQGIGTLSREAKRSLYLCTNRGSEVWGFDTRGELTARDRREATQDENAALDRAVTTLQKDLAALGLTTEVIPNRLNRRKLDLIPEVRWAAPKKADFRELLAAVTERLLTAGISGGLSTVIEDAYRVSRASGLDSPRITSDVKHIEIGLTDKSDSVRWVFDELIRKRRIPIPRVAVLGDEFGPIGEMQGSDALLRIPELQGAKFISVGVEPQGVPSFVEHLGGGPPTFIRFLDEQTAARIATGAGSRQDDESLAWQIIQEGFDPSREREMETLFAIGNGYLGVRATADFPVPTAQPDLFIAGVYDQKAAALPYSEVAFLTHGDRKSAEAELVPFPSPFQFQLRTGGARLSADGDMKTHLRKLNLKEGLYSEEHGFEDTAGRKTKIQSMRCASLVEPHLLIQRIRIQAENYSGSFELDFSNEFADHAVLYPHLLVPSPDATGGLTAQYRTHVSNVECVMGSKVFSREKELSAPLCRFDLSPGQTVEFLRLVCVYTSRESAEPLQDARKFLAAATPATLAESIRRHSQAWGDFWSASDVRFHDSVELTQAQRFNLYHLRIAAADDPKVSIPAKALTGRAYEGHIFWDVEVFIFPFFLYTAPQTAKNFLLYRYHTLDGARKRAEGMGHPGACYAWESAVSGMDVTPKSIFIAEKEAIPIFTGTEQIHVTADVAYAVWKFWDATQDDDFLGKFGAEILAETARFWTSRVSESPEPTGNAYHILGVVGPDEYHHDVDDNAYTNWMAKFNLEKAAWALEHLKDKLPGAFGALAAKIRLQEGEPDAWADVAQRLYIPEPNADGVIEQFRGFHALAKASLPEHERFHAPVSRLLNWKKSNQSRLIKQADVLMIPFLFPDALAPEVVAANYRYYEPLTDYGSSLSLCVYAAIAAQIGLEEAARASWEKSLTFDLENAMSNTALGIHAAAIGGSWQALVFHLLGVKFTDAGPLLRDRAARGGFPRDITLNLTYRGEWYPIQIGGTRRLKV